MSDRTYTYRPSIDQIVAKLVASQSSMQIIGVSGYGGSGKTTFATALASHLDSPLVGIDEFGTATAFTRSSDWSGLDRSRLIHQVLQPIREGVRSLTYDSCNDWDTWRTTPRSLTVSRFLVVEGISLFHPDLLPYFDSRIWIDVDLETATAQGIARARSLGEQAAAWKEIWEPNERDFEQQFHPRELADILVTSLTAQH